MIILLNGPQMKSFFSKIYKLILFQTQGSILQKSFVENSEDKTEALIVDKKKKRKSNEAL